MAPERHPYPWEFIGTRRVEWPSSLSPALSRGCQFLSERSPALLLSLPLPKLTSLTGRIQRSFGSFTQFRGVLMLMSINIFNRKSVVVYFPLLLSNFF